LARQRCKGVANLHRRPRLIPVFLQCTRHVFIRRSTTGPTRVSCLASCCRRSRLSQHVPRGAGSSAASSPAAPLPRTRGGAARRSPDRRGDSADDGSGIPVGACRTSRGHDPGDQSAGAAAREPARGHTSKPHARAARCPHQRRCLPLDRTTRLGARAEIVHARLPTCPTRYAARVMRSRRQPARPGALQAARVGETITWARRSARARHRRSGARR